MAVGISLPSPTLKTLTGDNLMKRNKVLLIGIILFCQGFAASAWGAGFALGQQGTAAMAQGNAFVAEASDASPIFYNPAGLN